MESQTRHQFSTVIKHLNFKPTPKMHLIPLVLLILALQINLSIGLQCPASSSISNTITSEEGNFSGSSNSKAYGVKLGSQSNSLYYLYQVVSGSWSAAMRKLNQDESLAWEKVISSPPIMKSLSVDASEQHVYFGSFQAALDVGRIFCSTGAIHDVQRFSFFGNVLTPQDLKIHTLSDSSGYYVMGIDSSNIANIGKYLFSSSSYAQCQQIPSFQNFAYGQLMLSDTTFFLLGNDASTPYSLHLYKLAFGNTSPDWALKLLCPSGSGTASNSESLLVSSTIYSFFIYGSSQYAYLAVISQTDGSVFARYKSSTSGGAIYGATISGDYIAASAECSSSNSLLLFNMATNTFMINTNTAIYLLGIETEKATGR